MQDVVAAVAFVVDEDMISWNCNIEFFETNRGVCNGSKRDAMMSML